ncbi:hypothetical protein ABKN59_009469 [Abortiporus biennis]
MTKTISLHTSTKVTSIDIIEFCPSRLSDVTGVRKYITEVKCFPEENFWVKIKGYDDYESAVYVRILLDGVQYDHFYIAPTTSSNQALETISRGWTGSHEGNSVIYPYKWVPRDRIYFRHDRKDYPPLRYTDLEGTIAVQLFPFPPTLMCNLRYAYLNPQIAYYGQRPSGMRTKRSLWQGFYTHIDNVPVHIPPPNINEGPVQRLTESKNILNIAVPYATVVFDYKKSLESMDIPRAVSNGDSQRRRYTNERRR